MFGELLGWGTHPGTGRVVHINTMGTEAPVLGTLLDLTLYVRPSWLFIYILDIVYQGCSLFCESFYQIIKGGVSWEPLNL